MKALVPLTRDAPARTQAHAVAAARWRTWLKAVQMRLGDRFISDDKRARLEAAQHKLQEALRSLDDAGVR